MKAIDLRGQRFGRLVAIQSLAERSGKKVRLLWECRCDCGATAKVRASHLRNGSTASCGCFKLDNLSKIKWKHGHTGSPEYICWAAMIQRCSSDGHHARNYKPKGIRVCDRWRDFRCFLADVGSRPGPEYSLDRIDPRGNYELGNVRWATGVQQQNNKTTNIRVKYQGEMRLISELPNPHGLSYWAIYNRIFTYGYDVGEAINTPPGKIRKYHKGKRGAPRSQEMLERRNAAREMARVAGMQRP